MYGAFPFKILVSLRDRLVQYKIVHRVYLTPARVHRMRSSLSPERWRCDHAQGDYIHIFWSCPVITVFWSQVFLEVNELFSISIVPSPRICLLGLVEDLVPRVAERTLLGLLLFYARKSIILCWKHKAPPSLDLWKTLVNNVIPLYRDTYTHRGWSKYDRVWSKWLAEPSTAAAD